jgi:iduronate 2-sulfatase
MLPVTQQASPQTRFINRKWQLSLMLAVVFGAPFLSAVPAPDMESWPLNVLFISIDDLRCEVGASEGGRALTPNIDRLAAVGVKFDRAYAQYPLCNASRASTLFGRYPRTSELYGNRDWMNARYPDWVSLPRYFRQQGYFTLRSGKIFHGDRIDDAAAWTVGGFAHEYNDPKPAAIVADRPITRKEEEARLAKMRDSDIQRAPGSDYWQAVGDPAELALLEDTRSTDRAIEFLQQRKPGSPPFFFGLGLFSSHSPLVAPQAFYDLYDLEDIELPVDFAIRPKVPEGFPPAAIRAINADLFIERDAQADEARAMVRAYLACTPYADWNVGRVIKVLEEEGLLDSTLIVLWSDHGYQLGEKRKWSKAGSLWEQGVWGPMIIHHPEAAGNGRTSPRVVELLDLYSTWVDLCGLPMPEGIEGQSLRPLLANPAADWAEPAFSVWSERDRGISGAVVRTEQWRFAKFYGPGAGIFLTNPQNDPDDVINLAHDSAYADVVAQLSTLLDAHVAGRTEPTPDPLWFIPRKE